MTGRETKLRSALEQAKEKLRDSIHANQSGNTSTIEVQPKAAEVKAQSKLNTLLGRTTVSKTQVSLFQRVGVPQRPTYDLIADRVLGPDVGKPASIFDSDTGYASHVAHRLKLLQERLQSAEELEDLNTDDDAFVGVERDGEPVWSNILNEHRGRVSNELDEMLSPPSTESPFHSTKVLGLTAGWPSAMTWADRLTFKQWFVGEENFKATQLCERAIDLPARALNPVYIQASEGAGCSHLLHATGQALLRRQEGHVLMVSAADLLSVDALEPEWQESLASAVAIIVDDVHDFASHEGWSHQLGILLDQAINMGLQVVAGGRISPADMPPSRLKEVLRTAAIASLQPPSSSTLMAFGQWRCSQRNLLLGDVHLARLVQMQPMGYRPLDMRLEQVSIAFDSGEVLLDGDDIAHLLAETEGPSPRQDSLLDEHQRVEDLAHQLIGNAMDHVYSTLDTGGIELHSSIQPMKEDTYQPPEWDEATFSSDTETQFDRNVRESIQRVTPAKPSVLDVHEREEFLLNRHERLEHADVNRAVDVLVDLDEVIDSKMNETSRLVVSNSLEMNRLEERMVVLAQRAVDADIEELIAIADELRILEERLVELDPEREPLPPFEEDEVIERKHRKARRRTPVKATEEALDSYEPEGEWDVNPDDVNPSELLQPEASGYNVVHLARLRKRNVLQGEEE